MNIQKATDIAETFIKKAEDCKLTPYLDSGGVPTDGYGNTHLVRLGTDITQQQADLDLEYNLGNATHDLLLKLKQSIIDKLTDNEGASLISFVFNCGVGNWRIWRLLNAGKFDAVPAELLRFVHVNGKFCQGLENRRKAEIALWNKEIDANFNGSVSMPNELASVANLGQPEPKPDPVKQQQANTAIKPVMAITAVSASAVAGKIFGFNPQVLIGFTVGFLVAMFIILCIALYLYYKDKQKPVISKYTITHIIGEISKTETFEMASAAFTQAVSNLQAAYQAKIDAANAQVTQLQSQMTAGTSSVQAELDTANATIANLQQQLANLDQEDTQAVIAATPTT
jgi:lysozyme